MAVLHFPNRRFREYSQVFFAHRDIMVEAARIEPALRFENKE